MFKKFDVKAALADLRKADDGENDHDLAHLVEDVGYRGCWLPSAYSIQGTHKQKKESKE
jgi:hypothetical protein